MGWFYVITQEMIEWGLSGNELLVYALINGYSQRGQGCYWGSLDTTAKVCGISRATAARNLQSLIEKGFIRKTKAVINDEFCVAYSATVVSKCDSQSQNETKGSLKMRPYNKDIDNKVTSLRDDNSIVKFNFRNSLICLGVSEEVADAWMAVRKSKRAVNSEIAFNAIKREIAKSGLTPDNAIRIAVERSWQGFQADWLLKDKERKVAPRERKESVFEHNIRVFDQMNGTNNHELLYGKKEVYDEQ